MTLCRITGPWANDPNHAGGYLPQLLLDHPLPAGASAVDVTDQPVANIIPTPNLLTVQAANYPPSWLTAVEADSNYAVLWSE